MRKSIVLCLVAAAFALAGPVFAGGSANVYLGQKMFDDDRLELGDVDTPIEYGVGVALDFDWPVMLTIDVLRAEDDNELTALEVYEVYYGEDFSRGGGVAGGDLDIESTELHVGVRYEFLKDGNIRPYVGGGVNYTMFDVKFTYDSFAPRGVPTETFTLVDDDDSDLSFFAGGGVLFKLGEAFSIGLDARYSDAEAEFGDSPSMRGKGIDAVTVDSGGIHVAVTAGFHW